MGGKNFYVPLELRGDGGLTADSFTMMLGTKLGSGIDREVYVCKFDEDQVIKIETGTGNFQNVMELLTWHAAVEEDNPVRFQLARVYQISTYGCWLRMERTWRPPPEYEWPARMPAFFTDFKRDNFGLTKDGRLVCHDYGTNMALYRGIRGKAQRKAEWWD